MNFWVVSVFRDDDSSSEPLRAEETGRTSLRPRVMSRRQLCSLAAAIHVCMYVLFFCVGFYHFFFSIFYRLSLLWASIL